MNVRLASLRKLDAQLERNDVEGARSTLRSLMPRQASAKAKDTRARIRARKAAKSEKHRLSTKEILAEVRARADEVCELPALCNRELAPAELHHMEGGSGRRREKQSVANTVLLCRMDHQGYHRDPEEYRAAVALHCSKYGYPVPSRFLREPWLIECDRCDGCGWYEGGKALKTTCERCHGTGSLERRRPSGPSPVHAQGVK